MPRPFGNYQKNLSDKSDHSIPPLRENNTLVPDDTDKANIFNDYFASISSLDPYESVPKLPDFNFSTESGIEHISTNELEVYRLLTKQISTNLLGLTTSVTGFLKTARSHWPALCPSCLIHLIHL